MAIDTDNEKFALISYQQNWNTPIPISDDIGNDGDKQHLIWEYPGIVWSSVEEEAGAFMAAMYYYTALLAGEYIK